MHKQIEELVSHALNTIDTELKQAYPEDSNERFKTVISELAKIKLDPTDQYKGYHYYSEAYNAIVKFIDQTHNNTLWDSITDIGFLLDERHPLYPNIIEDEFQNNPRKFIEQSSEELYHYLLGVAELGQYE